MDKNLINSVNKFQRLGQDIKDSLTARGAWGGWYKTLADLYPDNAHFVFELLQNAEDANATKVSFQLENESLVFKHNGTKEFNEKDIDAITNIGDSKKEINKIGKFGIGFKSVFSYTTSPKIHSKDISFEIQSLVIPFVIDSRPIDSGYTTLFIFPFDKEDKPANKAFSEIKRFFDELDDSVLIFLTNISSIELIINNRKPLSINKKHVGDFMEISNVKSRTSTWLVNTKEVKVDNKTITIGVAFSYDKEKKELQDTTGNVSIFFPAKKETSKLRFHIDAPFSSSVARDSIVDSVKNNEILANIAQLCAQSVHKIKELGLLKMSFFEIMPNEDDELDKFYKPILKALKEEFESEDNKLIPVENNLFSSLNECLYVSRSVKDTFSNVGDINVVFDEDTLIGFARNPRNNSRSDKFISDLVGKREFDDEDVYSLLSDLEDTFMDFEKYKDLTWFSAEEREDISKKIKWLENKTDPWLQSFYVFLGECEDSIIAYYFVKLADGGFGFRSKYQDEHLYFPEDNVSIDAELCFIDKNTYTSGKNKKQQEKAKSFLESVGVENIDESTHIKYLFNYYKFVSTDQHLSDINRLVAFYVDNKDDAISIVSDTFMGRKLDTDFILSDDYIKNIGEEDAFEDKPLVAADSIFIDTPYEDTGMKLIYSKLDDRPYELSDIYQDLDNTSAFLQLLKDLGAYTEIKIDRKRVYLNPYSKRLYEAEGKRFTDTGINRDWQISRLGKILQIENDRHNISKLLWDRLSSADRLQFFACYRMNSSYEAIYTPSQLICTLREYEWIPDSKEGVFHKPCDITEEMLPDGFSPNNSNGWLDHIGLGTAAAEKVEKDNKKKKAFEDMGLTPEVADILKDKSKEEIEAIAHELKRKTLEKSIKDGQGTGETDEVAPPQNPDSDIKDPDVFQDAVGLENELVGTKTKIGTKTTINQNPADIKKIRDFLYRQYSGHCQICGDTFKYKDRNMYILYSLNRSKKGDRLKSDVNRKGNSLSLCPKHHTILKLELQSFSFMEKFDTSKLSLDSIKKTFSHSPYVGKDDVFETNDGFYNTPEGDGKPFEADVFMLPIKLFKKTLYIKLTQEHIQNFIEVWNNN